ncbi:Rubredoxin-type Fe(Cys)4 protein [Coriobacterium glomerans PW2]|uniref:Rubredoxin-type Fe(Cys)4 protein n=1 Tax=Coriobacterium glomerans (strain ATCC 49209 / DSM 20642 / JCM 10262 / PW2) TaxID=700015 RepID=F2N7E7_CORGP|nr:Rubredoxin-type Fe(Cys)4 protein [Coriobacterium glomerans PW2]
MMPPCSFTLFYFQDVLEYASGYTLSAMLHSDERTVSMSEKKTYKFVCQVCGYEVEVDTPELPEDFVCPVCGVGPDQFDRVDE